MAPSSGNPVPTFFLESDVGNVGFKSAVLLVQSFVSPPVLACSMKFWPSGLRRWLNAPVRKGVGSNPTDVIFDGTQWLHVRTHTVLRARLNKNLAELSQALASSAKLLGPVFEFHSHHFQTVQVRKRGLASYRPHRFTSKPFLETAPFCFSTDVLAESCF